MIQPLPIRANKGLARVLSYDYSNVTGCLGLEKMLSKKVGDEGAICEEERFVAFVWQETSLVTTILSTSLSINFCFSE